MENECNGSIDILIKVTKIFSVQRSKKKDDRKSLRFINDLILTFRRMSKGDDREKVPCGWYELYAKSL